MSTDPQDFMFSGINSQIFLHLDKLQIQLQIEQSRFFKLDATS